MPHTQLKVLTVIICLALFGCSQTGNPPMPGFNVKDSDVKATEIADAVMAAQGGRQNWDATHFVAWNFFGNRKLIWDKYSGNVRIEYLKNDMKILVNINDLKGKVFKDGAEITQPDSLAKYLEEGRKAWINDSYWLVMPFKMKDSGLTLKYVGENTTAKGAKADVVQLTFVGVGVTPNNKYKVWVDKQTHLVSQWAHYKDAAQPEPNFITSWEDYQPYGKIKLSALRGPERRITDIYVFDKLPETVFTSFDPVDLSKY